MKKGQSFAVPAVATIAVVVITVLITFWIYGTVSNVFPHDRSIVNESICTTCVNGSSGGTTYVLANEPVLNDSTFICRNATGGALMTRGVGTDVCLGYNVLDNRRINITNTSADNVCQITNMQCSYTFDEANDNENSYWTTATSNINSSYVLASISPIILAAVIVITIVLLLRRQ